jgi:endonuclease V-like protein UPF0215 family
VILKLLVSGVDDGYFPLSFKGRKGKAPLISVIYDNFSIKNIDLDFITVDGEDATEIYSSLDKGDITIIDSVICGGFNYIKPTSNFIYFFGKKPNNTSILNALKKHFRDDNERIETINKVIGNLTSLSTKKGTVFVYTDLDLQIAKEIIEKYQIFVKYPEPIRSAHIIGRSVGQLQLKVL